MMSSQSERRDQRWPPDDELDNDQAECIELHIPAKPALFRVARMTTSAIGALAGLDVEQIADVRIAIDELCTICADGAGASTTLSLVARFDERSLLISCTASPLADDLPDPPVAGEGVPPGLSQHELAERILEALVDAYAIDSSQRGVRRGWLRKSR